MRSVVITWILPMSIAVLGAGLLGGYIIYNKPKSEPQGNASWHYVGEADRGVSPEAPVPPPEGWKQYRHAARGFTLFYPPDLVPKEYDEGSGTYTITFEPEGGGMGFQIFLTPYSGDAITQSRLLKDIPSGEFSSPEEILVGNGSIRAITFESRGPLGQMREVWFLNDGYLFEVTGYKELEAAIAEVVRQWSFEAAPQAL